MKDIKDMTREELEQAFRNEIFKNDLLRQEVEALGNVNRHYFRQVKGYCAESDDELMEFYINQGAAKRFLHRRDQ